MYIAASIMLAFAINQDRPGHSHLEWLNLVVLAALTFGPLIISLRHRGLLTMGVTMVAVALVFVTADLLLALGVIHRKEGEELPISIAAFYVVPISLFFAAIGAGIRNLRRR